MITRDNQAETIPQQPGQPVRRLSFLRMSCAILLLIGVVAGSVYAIRQLEVTRSADAATATAVNHASWFAAYVDVTATPEFAFEQLGVASQRNVVLSFIVSSPTSACTPTWGAAYTLDEASKSLDLERRIAWLQQQGGHVAVSFGGSDNHELAVNCTDPAQLERAYKSVIDRYDLDTIDLDLESSNLTDLVAAAHRATVLAKLQAEQRAAGKHLAIWLTLPVTPQGLSVDGMNGITMLLTKGVDLAGVNIMTMDYGSSLTSGKTMLSGSEDALTATHDQLDALFGQVGIHLTSEELWAKLGATPMIGQNDVEGEVFALDDAQAFNQFARSHGVGRLSMWSANRDIACGSSYAVLNIVSDSCSGTVQGKQQFTTILGAGFDGNIADDAGLAKVIAVTRQNLQKPDDPATSPYPIWTASAIYLVGSKVVWRHMVYEAKWWTQGDPPYDPALQSWETPWELIGPVMPGEKASPLLTLPANTYSNWSGTAIYTAGKRVMFNGVAYQAKWWNQGQSPATAVSDPIDSPWTPLTQDQIKAILAKK